MLVTPGETQQCDEATCIQPCTLVAEELLAAASGDLQLCVARLYKQRAGGLAAARPELESDAVSQV